MGPETGYKSQFTLSLLPPRKNAEHVNVIYCGVGGIQRTALLDYDFLQGRDHDFSFCVYP